MSIYWINMLKQAHVDHMNKRWTLFSVFRSSPENCLHRPETFRTDAPRMIFNFYLFIYLTFKCHKKCFFGCEEGLCE